jgi:uncharacterized protein
MICQDIDNIRRLFKAVEDRDIAGVLTAYDPEIVIREAESLPYGGTYHGLEGAKQHIEGAARTWDALQPSTERNMEAVFLNAEDYVIVLWRLKGLAISSLKKLALPVVSVYKMCDGKIIESQMFYADTVAIRQFLEGDR